MAVVELVPNATDAVNGIVPDFVLELGKVATWLQAVGVILILWLVFQIVSFILSYKRRKHLKRLVSDLERLEKKIDKLLKSKKK